MKLLQNPFFKTFASQIGGLALASLDNVIQAGPTGGSQSWLSAHPIAVPMYSVGVGMVHNTLSFYADKLKAAEVPPPLPINGLSTSTNLPIEQTK